MPVDTDRDDVTSQGFEWVHDNEGSTTARDIEASVDSADKIDHGEVS